MGSAFRPRDWRSRLGRGPALVALLVGVAFTLTAFWAMRGWERAVALRRAEDRFAEQAENVSLTLQRDTSRLLAASEGVEALFEASVDVTREEFDTFTRGLLRQNPYVRRFAWAPRVDAVDRAAFEAEIAGEVPGFAIRAGDDGFREVLFPVTYLAPPAPAEGLGLDLGGVAGVREAATRAIGTGRASTVGPLSLAALGGGEGVGFAVLLPFYRATTAGTAPVLRGLVLGLFDVGALVAAEVSDLDLWLIDAQGTPRMAWHAGLPVEPSAPPETGLVRRTALTLGDQVWTLTLAPASQPVPAGPGGAAWGVLALGLVASTIGAVHLAWLRGFAADLEAANTALRAEMERRIEAERTRERLADVLEATSDLVAIAEPGDHLVYLNRAGRSLLGFEEGEDLRHALLGDLLTPASREHLASLGRGEDLWQGELELRREDGEAIPAIGVLQAHRRPSDAVAYKSAIAHDIRERKAAERELERHAYYDELTGLPNRHLLERRLGEAIARADGRRRVGVFLLAPDRFRFVSLTLGPAYRDLAMRALARRLETLVRPGETLAHYLGDTFALVLPSVDAAGMHRVRDVLFEAMAEPLTVDSAEIRLGINLGGCSYPEDGTDVAALLTHADAALHEAATLGGGCCRFFTSELQSRLRDRVTMEAELRQALERQELTLHYQPQLSLVTGHVAGVEALLRWRHPRLGLLAPSHFVGVAEDSRLILPIGEWALQAACAQARAWREAGVPVPRMGVNVSSHQLAQADLEAKIRRTVREAGLGAGQLELELTESVLLADPDEVRDLLGRLRDAGCHIAIDDFGTGYSSLSYLKKLPVDRLKIDQSFVRDVVTDARSAGIARTILALAGNLGVATIAEGVSTPAQVDFLRREGCPEIQGYVVSAPVPAEEIPALVGAKGLVPA